MTKIPPQDLEAERNVLGAILLSPRDTFPRAKVRAEDFYRTAHGDIFRAMESVKQRGHEIDIITVADDMRKGKALETLGGVSYLSQLLADVVTAANYSYHERVVLDHAARRRILKACVEAEAACYRHEAPEKAITDAVNSLNESRTSESNIVPYRSVMMQGHDAIQDAWEHRDTLRGFTTGFPGIDRMTNGLRRKWLYILAGRTGRGKTALSMQIARAAAKAGTKVGLVSVEMDPEQLALRDIACESGVPLKRLLSGSVHDSDWERIAAAEGRLASLPMWCEFSAFTAESVERSMNHLAQVHGCQMIVVDYLQLLSLEDHNGTREQEVSKISRMHKRKAKELNVAMIALAQLNRAIENRVDKKPTLADLRESGSLEQDADVVSFVHQEECKCLPSVECACGNRYRAWYLQRKGRMNGTGDVELKWRGNITRFEE